VYIYIYGEIFTFCTSPEQDPIVRPLVEHDSNSLESMLPEIPLWVKNPDFDRVCSELAFILFLYSWVLFW